MLKDFKILKGMFILQIELIIYKKQNKSFGRLMLLPNSQVWTEQC